MSDGRALIMMGVRASPKSVCDIGPVRTAVSSTEKGGEQVEQPPHYARHAGWMVVGVM